MIRQDEGFKYYEEKNNCKIYDLQITDRKDPNWWQACKVDTPDVVGLVPSPELEERRKAFVPPEADFVHKIGICGTWVSYNFSINVSFTIISTFYSYYHVYVINIHLMLY